MLANLLLAAAFQVGPFYEQKPAEEYFAVRPFYAQEGETTDVLWPLFTAHRDWWRFCFIVNWQDDPETDGYQFSVVPFWFNGKDAEGSYAGLFPLYGHNPHIGMVYDLDFALWPLWHRYKMPRAVWRDGRREQEWMTSNAVLFPFVSWRSDGSWGVWPLYGVNHQRESDHRYFLWPFVSWASYREDRDTAGAGYSWTVMPFYGRVRRQYEQQDSFLPPFFSVATTWSKRPPPADAPVNSGPESVRIRAPWPLVEFEHTPVRQRLSIWPFYETDTHFDYTKGEQTSHVTRFGWKLIELYDDETRVFPFYASGRDHFRLWPLWETEEKGEVKERRVLGLFPIRWVPQIDRNWSKFWTLYEHRSCPLYTDHSLLWGLIRWRTMKE